MPNHMSILLVGAGYMGKEYCKVLKAQSIPHIVVCRSEASAIRFQNEMGVLPRFGGVEKVLPELNDLPTHAIIAVNPDLLMETAVFIINSGIKNILLEKPGGLNTDQIKAVYEAAEKAGATVYVAYNRRFYASTDKAMEIIKADGGVSSFCFEFTEWGFVIETLDRVQEVKDALLLCNSSHVIDLAFFLGGYPDSFSAYKAGELPWHKNASQYAGAGNTKDGALFSYQANWDAPGRWSVEILTKEHRLYFKPMEKLAIQNTRSVEVSSVDIDEELDVKFKPGLFNEVKAFLTGEKKDRLATIKDQLDHMPIYEKIEFGGR